MLKLHVEVQRTLRSIELVTPMVRADKVLFDFVSTTPEMLLPSTSVSFEIVS